MQHVACVCLLTAYALAICLRSEVVLPFLQGSRQTSSSRAAVSVTGILKRSETGLHSGRDLDATTACMQACQGHCNRTMRMQRTLPVEDEDVS
jgi:hypothetical protein